MKGPGDSTGPRVAEQVLLSGLATGAILALAGLAFAIGVLGSRVYNLATPELLAAGVAAVLLVPGAPGWAAGLLGAGAGAVAGLLTGWGAIRPFLDRPPIWHLAATLAAGTALLGALTGLAGSEPRRVPAWWTGELQLGDAVLGGGQVGGLVASLLLAGLVVLLLQRTGAGRAIRAAGDGLGTTALLGLPGWFVFSLSMALAGSVAALGGLAGAQSLGVVSPVILAGLGLKGLAVATAAGFRPVPVILAGLGIGMLEAVLAFALGPAARDLGGWMVLAVVILVRTRQEGGILGRS